MPAVAEPPVPTPAPTTPVRDITLGHSPDPDDAFMFYPLAAGTLKTPGLNFVHILQDIQTLNERATRGELDVTAISIHAYAFVQDKYALLTSGASFGDRYGPMIVTRRPMSLAEARQLTIAVPGTMTSAFLALRLCIGDFAYRVVPFDEIIPQVVRGEADAGLIIHEGQLTYAASGLHKVIDLGEWWYDLTGGLPLPLGGNAIRKDLGPELLSRCNVILRRSIEMALADRGPAVRHSMKYARDMEGDLALADKFVGMYVNGLTLDYGERGRRAVELFLRKGHEAGYLPHPVAVEFVA
jgi:1,4-dihydroxy-6-naphthoate synthase